ncbi:MAG: hypothetical protein OXG36_19115 [Caldilineaceae bacterium]|nr:hypothetical protein [Caldilineaceae bacterium]
MTRCAANWRLPSHPANRFEGWFGRFNPRARLARGLKTEESTFNFVRLMARGMA